MPSQEMIFGSYYLTLMFNKSKFIAKKYFNSEYDALNCFYKKNITIHTPILINYKNLKLKFRVKNNDIYSLNINNKTKKTNIKVLKRYLLSNSLKKYCFITSNGILIAYKNENEFTLNNLFLETTPGRLIFSNILKNKIKTY
jgi:hypothetical protein